MQGIRSNHKCRQKDTIFHVYGIREVFVTLVEPAESYVHILVNEMPINDGRMPIALDGVAANAQPEAYRNELAVTSTFNYGTELNVVRSVREYRDVNRRPVHVWVALCGDSSGITNPDGIHGRVSHVRAVGKNGEPGVALTALPEEMVEHQCQVDGFGTGAPATHYALDEEWWLSSGWCVGHHHVMIQTNHAGMVGPAAGTFRIYSLNTTTSALRGGTTEINGTGDVWYAVKGAAHDAPWVVAYNGDTGALATGRMESSTGTATLLASEVANVIRPAATLSDLPLHNVRWYDRVKGFDYVLVHFTDGGDTATKFYDGRLGIWADVHGNALAAYVDDDGRVYVASSTRIAKLNEGLAGEEWTHTMEDPAGASAPLVRWGYADGELYLDGNENWLVAQVLRLDTSQATVGIESCNSRLDAMENGELLLNNPRGWSISFDGQILIPHRTYLAGSSNLVAAAGEPEPGPPFTTANQLDSRYYKVQKKDDDTFTDEDDVTTFALLHDYQTEFNDTIIFREEYAGDKTEFARPILTDAVRGGHKCGCAPRLVGY